jgi:hypothetical protein
MKLTDYLAQVAVGVVLSDGSCSKGNKGTVLSFSQSTKHTLYFLYVFFLFFDFIGTFPYLMSRYDARYLSYTYSWQFATLQFPCFDFLYFLFYDPSGKKAISPLIGHYLTDVGLAHWIMGDGSKVKAGGLFLATHSYTEVEVDLLVSVLRANFDLDCHKIIRRNRNSVYWRIYISGKPENFTKLTNLVKPHMHVSMYYKLGL